MGYGFPLDSFARGLKAGVDLIAVDAGSIDAGPYYLGSTSHYVGLTSLRRDLTYMLRAALEQHCPCIIGSAGFSGANPQCDEVVEIVRDIIATESDRAVKLSVIHADIHSGDLVPKLDQLVPLGKMPSLTLAQIEESKIVGQMGIEPIMTALALGAEVIVCGRAYDPAVFAAAPIAEGLNPGLCYHVGKILECGAIAAVPGSGSDCLIAEIYADNHAEIFSSNPARECTPASIAAHCMYEKSRPDFFYLPGGILDISQTEFYALDNKRVGIKGSRFISQNASVKLEGSRALGRRSISIVAVDKTKMLLREGRGDKDLRVYGINGVEASRDNQELGIIVCVNSNSKDAARDVLAALRSGLLHYGYSGRFSTAGNLAFPCSPSDFIIEKIDQQSCFFIAGTRDPIFQTEWAAIQSGLLKQVTSQLPELAKQCTIDFHSTNSKIGFAYVETCEDDVLHDLQLQLLEAYRFKGELALTYIDAGLAYEWTLYHLLSDPTFLERCFEVEQWNWNDRKWHKKDTYPCDWSKSLFMPGELPDETRGHIPFRARIEESQYRLMDIAEIIRSKNAGINEITYDILFKSVETFYYAINSGIFIPTEIAKILQIPVADIIGCYTFLVARAIKITAQRQELAGNPGDRDVFGAQQHKALLVLWL